MYIETIKKFVGNPYNDTRYAKTAQLMLAAAEQMLYSKQEAWFYGYKDYPDNEGDYCYDITAYKMSYDADVGTIKCEWFEVNRSERSAQLLEDKATSMGATDMDDTMELLNAGKLVWLEGPQYKYIKPDLCIYIV